MKKEQQRNIRENKKRGVIHNKNIFHEIINVRSLVLLRKINCVKFKLENLIICLKIQMSLYILKRTRVTQIDKVCPIIIN